MRPVPDRYSLRQADEPPPRPLDTRFSRNSFFHTIQQFFGVVLSVESRACSAFYGESRLSFCRYLEQRGGFQYSDAERGLANHGRKMLCAEVLESRTLTQQAAYPGDCLILPAHIAVSSATTAVHAYSTCSSYCCLLLCQISELFHVYHVRHDVLYGMCCPPMFSSCAFGSLFGSKAHAGSP